MNKKRLGSPKRLGLIFILGLTCVCPWTQAREVLFSGKLNAGAVFTPIPVVLSSKPLVFIVDTGSSEDILALKYNRLVGATLREETLKTISGEVTRSVYAIGKMKLGAHEIGSCEAVLVDINFMRLGSGFDINGFLGAKSLADCSLELLYSKNVLSVVRDPDPAGPHMKTTELIVGPIGKGPYIDAEIGGITVRFLIDTGASSYLTCDELTLKKLTDAGVVENAESRSLSMGVGGHLQKMISAKFVKGSLLGVPLEGSTIDLVSGGNTIGLALLSNLDTIIDFKNRKLFFGGYSGPKSLNMVRMLGAAIMYANGKSFVYKIGPQPNPASEAGLSEGDVIIKFAGVNGSELNASSLYHICSEQAGNTIAVEFINARTGTAGSTTLKIKPKVYYVGANPGK